MKPDNFRLSKEEWQLLQDPEILPHKYRLLQKLEALLSQLGKDLAREILLPDSWQKLGPKLSRGENYQMQSYRVMDFPRQVNGDSFFLFRSLILWGHPIGFHLIASGSFQQVIQERLKQNFHLLPHHWQLARHENPWFWEADRPGWQYLYEFETPHLEAELRKRKFLKISTFIPLEDYLSIPLAGLKYWQELAQSLIPFP